MAVTTKTWTGSDTERFTYTDMNRIISNAKSIATAIGYTAPSFSTVYRYSQFDYTEATKLEGLLSVMAEVLDVEVGPFPQWTVGRNITYIDINRWETACEVLDAKASSDGKYTYIVNSISTPDATWTLANSSGSVMSEGSGLSEIMAFRLSPGTYSLTINLYDDEVTDGFTLSANRSVDVPICKLTVNSPVDMVSLQYNGRGVSDIEGTSKTFPVIKLTESRLIKASVVNDSPRYSGVSSEYLWIYNTESTVVPKSSNITVALSSTKYGNVITLDTSGFLDIPISGNFGLLLIGGGAGGSVYGVGGNGGCVTYIQSKTLAAGNFEVIIGDGGAFNKAGGQTRFGTITADGASEVINESATGGSGGGGCPHKSYTDTSIDGGTLVCRGMPGSFGGGGGAGSAKSANTSASEVLGGAGGTYGGDGGAGGRYASSGGTSTSATAGSDGTILSDPLLNGADASGGSVGDKPYFDGGGGGGGCGAPGGSGGHGANMTTTASAGGGGGGGIAGGRGGRGGYAQDLDGGPARGLAEGGLGYGAGGGGAYGYYIRDETYIFGPAGGGGGGLGTVKLAQDTQPYIDGSNAYGYPGGAGAPGAIRIRYLG